MSQVNITVREFADSYKDIIGSGPDNQCSIDLINQARIIAYPLGLWVGLEVYRRISVVNGTFLLPYDLETIKGAKDWSGQSLNVTNVSYEDYCTCCGGSVLTRIEGRVYSPFTPSGLLPVSFRNANRRDNGVQIRVVYLDTFGSMHDETLEVNQLTETRLIHIPHTIKRISKPTTAGIIEIKECKNVVGYIYPVEKSPVYTLYCIQGHCVGSICINAKKKYIPYTLDDTEEILDINPEALTSFIIAIKAKLKRDSGWMSEYSQTVKFGKEFLEKELLNERDTSIGTHPVDYTNYFYDSLLQNSNQ